ncbi:MAG: GNAT family N-acetyltransferase [Alphaproteobacteria bacterium]|nr:GNAT family N-acetyltransferase [Alphaproteobacteria bacterium]MBU1513058.1 GNAT family N-acetyltransferase [Alphaproteobacteria bacterium]MBU2095166.1 GNAT family N-acetyltransferase [Alphaproteobacteria bacterium]MBU2152093.1 GNAT family N-acetyltransferase [Alphaproteobacteria bacterium]MBU2306417.1 GNAT family N-acetyltransferase [Alphaproteobacteria bacterium]
MSDLQLRPTNPVDAPAVLTLYRATAAAPDSGLARASDEMELSWVQGFLARATASGASLGVWAGDALAGEIHASRMGARQFDHNLMDLTVAVHPDWQGRGIGARLFEGLFVAAAAMSPKIERIELAVREGNAGAIRLYQRLGFVVEGHHPGRVRLPDGWIEMDLTMAKVL